jgi:hypothetical protein
MILKNVKIKWPRLGDNPGTKYASDETEWSVDCYPTSEESKQWVVDGYAQKERFDNESGEPFVKIKRNTHFNKKNPVTGTMDKNPISPPFVKDQYGDEMDPSNIGNGSVCNVQYMVRDWEYAGRSGKSPTLVGVQVVKLEEYSGGGTSDEFTYTARPTVEIDEMDEDVPF